MLLVRPVQSFIVGLRGNIDAAQQYMNVWAIQGDAAMEGAHVSRLVAVGFLEHANLDIGIANYRHLAAYFGGAIKQSYCTEFPIDETSDDALPSHGGETHLRVSQNQVAEFETW
jgi:hypothetical protein